MNTDAVQGVTDYSQDVGREKTFGEKAVGLTFNPGGDHSVTKVKEMYAEIIDFLDTARQNTKDGGKIRHLSQAIIDAETAQMRAVKGITWNSNN